VSYATSGGGTHVLAVVDTCSVTSAYCNTCENTAAVLSLQCRARRKRSSSCTWEPVMAMMIVSLVPFDSELTLI